MRETIDIQHATLLSVEQTARENFCALFSYPKDLLPESLQKELSSEVSEGIILLEIAENGQFNTVLKDKEKDSSIEFPFLMNNRCATIFTTYAKQQALQKQACVSR